MSLTVPSETNIDIIHARVHAQRAGMYEQDKLARLCRLRSFSNLVAELYPEQAIESHRQFEKRLTEDHLLQLTWILAYLGGRAHEFFLWLLRRYQIENIKVLFRGFHARRGPGQVGRYLIAVPEEFELPSEKMLSAPSADEFAELVPNDILRAAVMDSVQPYKKKGRPFFVEVALDAAFYSRLVALADEPLSQPASCLPLLVLDANIYLVVLVLRAKFNYSADFEDLEPFLHVPHAAPAEALRAIHSADTVQAAVQALPKSLAQAAGRTVDTVEDIELRLSTYFCARANAAFYGSGVSLAVPVAFYYLKRIELANLIRLSEAYRYGMSPAEMLRSLVPPLEQA